MKKYVRALLADLGKKRKDYMPPVPVAPANATVTDLDPQPQAPAPGDLSNQDLSKDPAEQVRQLDYQAQRLEEKGTMPG